MPPMGRVLFASYICLVFILFGILQHSIQCERNGPNSNSLIATNNKNDSKNNVVPKFGMRLKKLNAPKAIIRPNASSLNQKHSIFFASPSSSPSSDLGNTVYIEAIDRENLTNNNNGNNNNIEEEKTFWPKRKALFENERNDNGTVNVVDADQSTSESVDSNQYVVAYDHPNPSSFQENFPRQPLLVDNLLALSNELPPLTAALPMQYLYEPIQFATESNGEYLSSPVPITTTAIKNPIMVDHAQTHHQSYSLDTISPVYETEINLVDHMGAPLIHSEHNPHIQLDYMNYHKDVTSSLYDHLEHIPGIPGVPWKDYPIFSSVPKTSFQCNGSYGLYADMETGCQVWHYCQPDGRHDSFLCSNGTLFNQKSRVCDWWYNVDCKMSLENYDINFTK